MNIDSNHPHPLERAKIHAPGEVSVHSVALEASPRRIARMRELLTPDELERADRVKSKRHGKWFTIVRSELRMLLSAILKVNPLEIKLAYGPHGKPCLACQPAGHALHFNVSHTDSMALIAAAWDREVGVDIEALRPWEASARVAERFFSARENRDLAAIPEDDRLHAFFACWTRKEAFIKALGGGLTIPLKRFSVSVEPGEPARLLEMQSAPEAVDAWKLLDLPVPPPYIACLCAQGRDWKLVYDEGSGSK